MLNKKKWEGWDAIDEAAERAGGYLAFPKRPGIVDYNYRAMGNYAAQKGKTSPELTEDEQNIFRYDPPLVYD